MSEAAMTDDNSQSDLSRDLGYQLAKALEALHHAQEDFAETRADHKARLETLQKEINRLKSDILTGQKQLPLEPVQSGHDAAAGVN